MKKILIILVLICKFAPAQYIDWRGELKKTQASSNLAIQKMLSKGFDGVDSQNLDEIIENLNNQEKVDYRFKGLYEQFIHYRHSSPELNSAIFKFQIKSFYEVIGHQLYPSLKKFLPDDAGAAYAQTKLPSYEKALTRMKAVLRYDLNKRTKSEKFPEEHFPKPTNSLSLDKKMMQGFCFLNYPTQPQACKAFMKLIENTNVSQLESGAIFTRPDALRVLSENKLKIVLNEVTNEIMELINQSERGRTPKVTIVDVFQKAFLRNQFSKKETNIYLDKVLSIYGQRGASWATSFASLSFAYHQKNQKMPHRLFMSSLELSMIFSGMSVLDKYTWRDYKTHFSLPSNIDSPYLIGKPYYFWMSHTLAEEFSQNSKVSSKGIVQGIQLLNQAYQLEAEYNGRNPFSFYDNLSISPSNNLKRIDLVNTIIGATHGRYPESKISLGSSFRELLYKGARRKRDYSIGVRDFVRGERVSDKSYFRSFFDYMTYIDDERILMSVNIVNSRDTERSILNLKTGEKREIHIPEKIEGRDVNHVTGIVDKRYMFFSTYSRGGSKDIHSYYFDIETNKVRKFYSTKDEYLYHGSKLVPVFIKDDGEGKNVARYFDPYKADPTTVDLLGTRIDYDNQEFHLQSNTRDPIIVREHKPNRSLLVQNLKENNVLEIPVVHEQMKKTWRAIHVNKNNIISYFEFSLEDGETGHWTVTNKQYKNGKFIREVESPLFKSVPVIKGSDDYHAIFYAHYIEELDTAVLGLTSGMNEEQETYWNLTKNKYELRNQIEYSFTDKLLNKMTSLLLNTKYKLTTFVEPFVFRTNSKYFSHNSFINDIELKDIPPSIFKNLNNDWKKLLRPDVAIKEIFKQVKSKCNHFYLKK